MQTHICVAGAVTLSANRFLRPNSFLRYGTHLSSNISTAPAVPCCLQLRPTRVGVCCVANGKHEITYTLLDSTLTEACKVGVGTSGSLQHSLVLPAADEAIAT